MRMASASRDPGMMSMFYYGGLIIGYMDICFIDIGICSYWQ